MILQAFCDLYQNDEVLANNNLEQWSLNPALQRSSSNPDSEFELFSDRYVRRFSKYTLLDHKFLVANKNTPTINFDHLKNLLLSKDMSRMTEYLTLINGDCKFLDKKNNMIGNRVALASFPRTGNSFLRRVVE